MTRPSIPLARELVPAERELNRVIAESTPAKDLARTTRRRRASRSHVEGLGLTCVLRARRSSASARAAPDAEAATAHRSRCARRRSICCASALGAKAVDAAEAARTPRLQGYPQVAERFAKLLKLARPDLEDDASRWIGDVPAHALGEVARGAGAWLARAAGALRMNTAEYLQEESRAMPAALEAEAFYSDVERLRDDVERTAARLARLERR